MKNPFRRWFSKSIAPPESNEEGKKPSIKHDVTGIDPGRVSVPEDAHTGFLQFLKGYTPIVDPSFRVEVIQLLRNLYKINPDVSIALQDTFKLANTGHVVTFPNNTDKEADEMRKHLFKATARWSQYTAGIDGLVNKMITQLLVGGAISVEGVPSQNLDTLDTILFLKPDNIRFRREENGVYHPYQKNTNYAVKNMEYIKLNTETYVYASMYNDTDEPYGIPPFMAALDSLKGQADMKINSKHLMELMGMMGFLEAKMAKPDQRGNESNEAYQMRLNRELRLLKTRLKDGMKDGIVTGYIDDHEFKMNSTTKDMGNIDKVWALNQQSVANGLGVNGSLIGVSSGGTAEGNSVVLSKMISQLTNIQMVVTYVLKFMYSLELRLAGFNNKGMKITWKPSTVADDVKIQQANQYKIQNLDLLYKAGIISQYQYAWEMGYDSPDEMEPRVPLEQQQGGGNTDPQEATKKKQRQADKNQSARRSRDKGSSSPTRGDQNTKPR